MLKTNIIHPVIANISHKYGIKVGNTFETINSWSDTLRGISNDSENQNTGK